MLDYTTHSMMPRLLLKGNILKGKTPFETAISKVIKDTLGTLCSPAHDQGARGVESHHNPDRRAPRSMSHLRPQENRPPNSKCPFLIPYVRHMAGC